MTPLLSMLQVALDEFPGREIRFIQATRSKETLLFQSELEKLEGQTGKLKCYTRFSEDVLALVEPHESRGLVTAEYLGEILDVRDCEYYFCGPAPFMGAVQHILQSWNIPEEQTHFEFFGPKQSLCPYADSRVAVREE